MNYLILDIATTGIDGAEQFIDVEDIQAPANYKDPAAIDRYVTAERAKRLERAALDLDLARITMLGIMDSRLLVPRLYVCPDEIQEAYALTGLCERFANDQPTIVSFNGLRYDWPLIMRRAFYLDVAFPPINCDRYRTPHVDVWDRLSYHGAVPAHALTWYAKRCGWTDLVKPLTGAEEAKAAQDGRWDELRASVEHDLHATARLATKMGLIPAAQEEPIL